MCEHVKEVVDTFGSEHVRMFTDYQTVELACDNKECDGYGKQVTFDPYEGRR